MASTAVAIVNPTEFLTCVTTSAADVSGMASNPAGLTGATSEVPLVSCVTPPAP